MSKEIEMPKPGQVVLVTQGRDAGTFALVIRVEDERFVWIADGNKRRFDKPKKKNIRHIRPMPYFSAEVIRSLEETGRVPNSKLRFAIQKFISYYEGEGQEENAESTRKGEDSSG
ncbi:MAG: hypothetical protein BAA01_11080 [Bacillus thermozeamaize]|jgi:ribosomal protein L14E/L6E/L27E|uniref:KOW domain-containing protein n=1 Tax=Bacillus thermozeamaize TaxID=230954 RepID=A0A1Y3PP83_9BACI|nr:MAG: hypothetical protein BAA01_11080 [Bacillus thermozeamaize]